MLPHPLKNTADEYPRLLFHLKLIERYAFRKNLANLQCEKTQFPVLQI